MNGFVCISKNERKKKKGEKKSKVVKRSLLNFRMILLLFVLHSVQIPFLTANDYILNSPTASNGSGGLSMQCTSKQFSKKKNDSVYKYQQTHYQTKMRMVVSISIKTN